MIVPLCVFLSCLLESNERVTLEHACQLIHQNNLASLSSLLSSSSFNINSRHHFGWTLLHFASYKGSPEVVCLLLSLGADPNMKDESSLKTYRNDIANYFITRRAFFHDLDWQVPYVYDWTPLHYAVVRGDAEIIRALYTCSLCIAYNLLFASI